MKNTSNLTTKGVGFYMQIAAAVFVIVLTMFTVSQLAPAAQPRIEDAQSRLETLNAAKPEVEAAANASLATKDPNDKEKTPEEKALASLKSSIDFYEERITMLQNREKYYAGAMLVLVLVLLGGAVMQSIKTASFVRSDTVRGQPSKVYSYYPFIGAPLSSVCILLAIGVTYQSLFVWGATQLVMLIAAIVVGILAFVFYRRLPYLNTKLSIRYITPKLTWADLVFFAPAVCILLLLASLFLFGVTVNGAKLWLEFGGNRIQPGEFIKILLMILFASSYGKMWRALTAIGVSGLTMVAMLALHDMGTAVVVFAMTVAMLLLLLDNKITFSMYEHKKLLILLLILALPLFVLILAFFPYAMERFSNVGQAMQGAGETQQGMMLKALIFGGAGGMGIENFSYVYRIFSAESDMAIAGLTAIFGYGMLLILMLCYAVLVVVPLRKHALYREFYFTAVQFSVILTVQVLLNALGSVDVLPFTGIVAPFVSSGGSALVSFCAMTGLVLATLHPVIKPLEVKRS